MMRLGAQCSFLGSEIPHPPEVMNIKAETLPLNERPPYQTLAALYQLAHQSGSAIPRPANYRWPEIRPVPQRSRHRNLHLSYRIPCGRQMPMSQVASSV